MKRAEPESLVGLSAAVMAGERDVPISGLMVNTSVDVEEVADGVAFVPALSNVIAFATDGGLAVVDASSTFTAPKALAGLRRWSSEPIGTLVYTHGHFDHVGGMPLIDAEAESKGRPRPRVLAHEAVRERFTRYALTAGYNGVINRRQFAFPGLTWPTDYREPDDTYRDGMEITVGGVRIDLRHARGETDDHTWVHVPERSTICPGDFIIWCAPNAGNPQKVQRYAKDWALALRAMAAAEAELLLPSHGLPVKGRDNVRAVLVDTAELLESLHDQTVALMNAGESLDTIIHTVRAPQHLLDRPYLRPVYDDPEFIVRNVWRYYGGWWDGNPASLKPAADSALATEIAALAGGASRLAERAAALADGPDDASLRLAGHLAEMAALAAPGDRGVLRVRADVFAVRQAYETSLMAKGIFGWAVRDSAQRIEAATGADPS